MTDRYVKNVNGVEIPMTPEEIAERQAEENAPPPPLPLSARLDAIFRSLPDRVQAEFCPLKAGIETNLRQGNVAVVKIAIEIATVPSEFEDVRQSLLAQFA